MANQNLKAWQYRVYDMAAPNAASRTLNFTPPQVAVGQTTSGTNTGLTAITVGITVPQTTNATWFTNPGLASALGDQTAPIAAEMYLINQNQNFSISLTLLLNQTVGTTTSATFVLRPNEVLTIPPNTVAITSIVAGNSLNANENTIIVPLAGPTDYITLDFVTIV